MPGNVPRNWTTSSLGERIEHICEIRGIGVNELGRRAGFPSGTMSRLKGKTAQSAGKGATMARIAEAGHVRLEWLSTGQGPVEESVDETVPVSSSGQRLRLLRELPDWPTLVAEAKRQRRDIQEPYWTEAGEAYVRAKRYDWVVIADVAALLKNAAEREAAGDPDESSPAFVEPKAHSGTLARTPRGSATTPTTKEKARRS